ncbi:MAG: sigma-70 family RNA polymerase sigma factor [Planctomycetes bacterium]|nr:sigma-70 family RNA polymerase sigma factor [Planctomycetota bacterium]
MIQAILDLERHGDDQSFSALIACSCQRLRKLVHRMLHRQFPDLRRWEDTDDVLQRSLVRLHGSLRKIQPRSVREFYGLAATQIRWELIDLCRHYFGPHGLGANHESDYGAGASSDFRSPRRESVDDTAGPAVLLAWAEFHEHAGKLPDEEREVFDLLWYQQVPQADAAALLGVSIRTVKRRWQRAKLQLSTACPEQPPV